MLAQNFKSPSDLGIPSEDFDAALKVLNMLERDELVHLPLLYSDTRARKVRGFNMLGWCLPHEKDDCGTMGCIGGWMNVILHRPLAHETIVACYDLFFPGPKIRRGEITTEQAARALRNFLTYCSPRWDEVLAVNPAVKGG